ncbi:hypothetical protein ABT215_20570 [Streptomyces sp900105755]|uniref:hypothetical protein n=1 Tax=Streptomyces sp. 900105755 TaxID=3154389 RepID=UPI0033277436
MTHEPEQENRRDVDGTEPPIPPMPDHPPQAAAPEWGAPPDVLSGPRQDREPGAPLRDRWRRQSFRVRAVTVALVAGALALGGTVAFAAGSGGGPAVSPAVSGASSAPSAPDGRGPGHGCGMGGMGVHGEATVKDPHTGKYVVRIWQRGTVENVDGDQVTVQSDDGTAWTWTVGSNVKVRGDSDTLKKDAKAFLVGTHGADGRRTASGAFSGDFAGMGPRGGMHDHGGPWHHRPGDRTPSPNASGNGATT